ncbi:MAG: FliM/FliN family flagellar motor switch protein [Hyphomonadaceae bacterium]
MTNILRKKIALSTGIPPSVQNAEAFWDKLLNAVSAWSLKGLEVDAEPQIVRRELLIGEQAQNRQTEDEMVFFTSPCLECGLSGVSFSKPVSLECAARRMLQSVDDVRESSNVFLGLICEEPAMTLKESIRIHLTSSPDGFDAEAKINSSFENQALSPLSRYLEIEFELPLEAGAGQVKCFFEFNTLKTYLAARHTDTEPNGQATEIKKQGVLHKSVQMSDIRVRGVIERVEMSFGDCTRLKVGQILPLETANQNAIILAVDTVSGSTDISNGMLGVWKQNRAIKLNAPISENFVRDLAAS